MNVNTQTSSAPPKIALIALILGIISLIVLIASVLAAILIDAIGIVDFFGIVMVLALAGIVCGLIARNKTAAEKRPGNRAATTGLILGIVVLVLVIISRIAVFVYFIPWLGA